MGRSVPPAARDAAPPSGRWAGAPRAHGLGKVAPEDAEEGEPEQGSGCEGGSPGWFPAARRFASSVVSHPDFEVFILLVILVEFFALALFTPMDTHSRRTIAMEVIGMITSVIFFGEIVLRIAHHGSPWQWLSSPWNLMDLALILAGVLTFLHIPPEISGIRPLVGLRCIRPLLTLPSLYSLRTVLISLEQAIPMLGALLFVMAVGFVILGAMGTQLLAVAFHHECFHVDTGISEFEASYDVHHQWGCGRSRECPNDFYCGYHAGELLSLDVAGMDNVGAALLTAFQVSSLAGWSYVYYRVWDATHWSILLYFALIVLGSYLVGGLFVAVLKLKFDPVFRQQREALAAAPGIDGIAKLMGRKSSRMERGVSRSASAVRLLFSSTDEHHGLVARLQQLADSQWFVRFFLACVLVHTVFLAMEYDTMGAFMHKKLAFVNTAFVCLFALETVVKLCARPRRFWVDPYNVLDTVLIIIGFVELEERLEAYYTDHHTGHLSDVSMLKLRGFQSLRLLRIFKHVPSLKIIMDVVFSSIGIFGAVIYLLCKSTVLFALLGLHLFGHVTLDTEYKRSPNFNDLSHALISAFKVLTLEDWEQLMYSVMRSSGNYASFIYFVIWVILGRYMLMSLFLTVVVDAFETAYDKEAQAAALRALNTITDQDAALEDHDEVFSLADTEMGKCKDTTGAAAPIDIVTPASRDANSVLLTELQPKVLADLEDKPNEWASQRSCKQGDKNSKFACDDDARAVPKEAARAFGTEQARHPQHCAPSTRVVCFTDASEELMAAEGLPAPRAPDPVSVSLYERSASVAHSKAVEPAGVRFNTELGSEPHAGLAMGTAAEGADGCWIRDPVEAAPGELQGAAGRRSMRARLVSFKEHPKKSPSKGWVDDDADLLHGSLIQAGMVANPLKDLFNRFRGQTKQQMASGPSGWRSSLHASHLGGLILLSAAVGKDEAIQVAKSGQPRPPPPAYAPRMLGLPVEHPLRQAAIRITQHPCFDYAMYFCIIANCASMTLEHPRVPEDSKLYKFLLIEDKVFQSIFVLEACTKMVAMGIRYYFSVPTNRLDFGIASCSLIIVAKKSAGVGWAKSLKGLLAFKILRLVTRNDGILNLTRSIAASMANLVTVSILLFTVITVFCILGVHMYAGLFTACNDTSVSGIDECNGYFVYHGRETQRKWKPPFYNFDNTGNAFKTLFKIASLDGWATTMYSAMSIPYKKGLQPDDGSRPEQALFFVAFIVIVVWVIYNMYLGVVFYNFQKIKAEEEGLSEFNEDQREWYYIADYLLRLRVQPRPPLPAHPLRKACCRLVASRTFSIAVNGVVCISVLEMWLWWKDMPFGWIVFTDFLSMAVGTALLVEAAVKVLAHGWRFYWSKGWNKYDCTVAVLAALDIPLSLARLGHLAAAEAGAVLSVQRLLRTVRAVRLFRVFAVNDQMGSLVNAIAASGETLLLVGELVFIMFYVYAYLGVLLFAKVKHGAYIDRHANFETFWAAMITLVRVATNDNWAVFAKDLTIKEPYCSKELKDCGHHTIVVNAYLITFVSTVSMLMVNLMLTVVVDNVQVLKDKERWKVTPKQFEVVLRFWEANCLEDNTMHHDGVMQIVRMLPPPIGTGAEASDAVAEEHIKKLKMPTTTTGHYTFYHVMFHVLANVAEVPIPHVKMTHKLRRHLAKRSVQELHHHSA